MLDIRRERKTGRTGRQVRPNLVGDGAARVECHDVSAAWAYLGAHRLYIVVKHVGAISSRVEIKVGCSSQLAPLG